MNKKESSFMVLQEKRLVMKKIFTGYTEEERASWKLFICAWIVYAMISMVKNVYASAIASITAEGLFDKSLIGTINAGFYLFYGGAQLVGMKLLDKLSPTKMITSSLIGTLIACVGMAFARSFVPMLILWSFCGLVQFSIWPAILRVVSEYMLQEHQNRAKVYISFAYCAGMFVTYFIAAVVLKFAHWPVLFIVAAMIMLICLMTWIYVSRKTISALKNVEKTQTQITSGTQSGGSFFKIMMASGIAFLLFANFARSALDLGVKSWVPTMMMELYNISASFASSITTVLVFVNLAGIFIAGWIFPKTTKNLAWGYGLTFFFALPFTILLLFTGKIHIAFVVLFLTVVTTMMYAGHQFINVLIPSYFAKHGKAGSMAAAINSVACFGTVVSNIGFGYLAENFGWNATIWSWVILAAVGVVSCGLAAPLWKKFTKE